MKRMPLLRLAAVALMAAGVLVLLGSAAPKRGVAQSEGLPFDNGEGPAVEGHEGVPVALAPGGVTLEEPLGESDKLSWHLALLAEAGREAQAEGRAITSRTPSLLPKNLRDMVTAHLMRITPRGEVVVEVIVDGTTGQVASALAEVGAVVDREDAARGRMKARVPIASLEDAAAVAGVRQIRLPSYGFTMAGSEMTEGDAILNTDDVRSNFGVDGSGIKVGVISDGMEGLSDAQASGDLPYVHTVTCNVLPMSGDFSPIESRDPTAMGAGAEGTAMLEIVHDLAPGAELWFGYWGMYLDNYGTDYDFNDAVNCLAEHVDVVIDDIGWYNAGPYDGSSSVSQNTADALNHAGWPIQGYFNAVGNQANRHYEESYVYSGLYIDGTPPDSWDFHQFASTSGTFFGGYSGDPYGGGMAGDPTYFDHVELAPGGIVWALLQWDDPWGSSSNDYDLLVGDGTYIYYCSHNRQNGNDFAVEVCGVENTGAGNMDVDFFIGNYQGGAAARTFDMFLMCSGCQTLANNAKHNFNTPGSSVANNSDAGGSPVPIMSLGAIDQADSGNDDIEYYSSRGPTNDMRTKPDATAIDGVSVTGSGGFGSPFYGTSAAGPHAGGMAALLLQCDPSLDRAGLRSAMLSTAVDLGDAGTDNTFGAGRLDALAAAMSGVCPDTDSDQFTDAIDNCPSDYNPGQDNTDAADIDNGPVVAGDDVTNASEDGAGDVCDDDDDNDWMLDTGTHPTLGTPGEDVGCGSGPTDPLSADSDGDRVVDGAECLLGSDPNDPASKPVGIPPGDNDGDFLPASVEALFGSSDGDIDSDGDGLSDGTEVKGWGTSPTSMDSGGNGCDDDKEVASVNDDKQANILDLLLIVKRAFNVEDDDPADGDPVPDLDMVVSPAFDINRDGAMNVLDLMLAVLNSSLVEPHDPCP